MWILGLKGLMQTMDFIFLPHQQILIKKSTLLIQTLYYQLCAV